MVATTPLAGNRVLGRCPASRTPHADPGAGPASNSGSCQSVASEAGFVPCGVIGQDTFDTHPTADEEGLGPLSERGAGLLCPVSVDLAVGKAGLVVDGGAGISAPSIIGVPLLRSLDVHRLAVTAARSSRARRCSPWCTRIRWTIEAGRTKIGLRPDRVWGCCRNLRTVASLSDAGWSVSGSSGHAGLHRPPPTPGSHLQTVPPRSNTSRSATNARPSTPRATSTYQRHVLLETTPNLSPT